MLNNWKPKSNYNIFVSRNHTNRFANKLDSNYDTVIDKANAFRARPLKHYRRQYVDKNNKSNHNSLFKSKAHLTSLLRD